MVSSRHQLHFPTQEHSDLTEPMPSNEPLPVAITDIPDSGWLTVSRDVEINLFKNTNVKGRLSYSFDFVE